MSRNRPGRKFSTWIRRASEERQVADIESFSLTRKICFYKGLPSQPEGPEGGVSLPGSSTAPQPALRDEVPGLTVVHQLTAFSRKGGRSWAPPSVWFLQSGVGVGGGVGRLHRLGSKMALWQQVLCVQPAFPW